MQRLRAVLYSMGDAPPLFPRVDLFGALEMERDPQRFLTGRVPDVGKKVKK